jgi:dermatan 4-sulfotransferase 1
MENINKILEQMSEKNHRKSLIENDLLFFRDHNLFYAACSKNACSKIKSILGEINTGQKFIEQSPHKKENTKLLAITDLDKDEAVNALFGDQVFRFAFVRNPFDRAISCYLNRIKKLGLEKYDNPQSAIKEHQDNISQIKSWKKSFGRTGDHIEFEDFIEFICQQQTYDMDRHWLPQHISLHTDIIKYNFIGKLEKFEVDMDFIFNQVNIDWGIINLKKKVNPSGNHNKLNYYFDGPLRRIFEEKYHKDFELFYNTNNFMSK